MFKRLALLGAVAALALGLSPISASAETMADIISKGKLVVGVKTDYPPWGMRDKDGKIVGMEIDMANDIGKRLSAKAGKPIAVEVISVVASNRMQFLQQGQIDLMIATMNDKPDRRKAVGITLPNYYASGVAVMAHKDSGIKGWADLKGKNICTIQGAWYNKDWGDKHGANLIAFPGRPEAEKALLDGRCVGWLYDDTAFGSLKVLDADKWKNFTIATPVVAQEPWAIAVRSEDRTGPWGKFVSEATVDWLASGTLLGLEKKWGLPQSQWLKEMSDKCKAKDPACDINAPY
jgi:polar amino acid transport system substrate-binding protein